MRSLLSDSNITVMKVGFLPFIPNPVTEASTVFTAMKNFDSLAKNLAQGVLPVFCDEGFFRIVWNIFLQREEEFKCLIPMLGAFHMAKCVLHCIRKYVKGCGLGDSFLETNIFGLKVLESVLSASNYVRALRGIQILQCSIEAVKMAGRKERKLLRLSSIDMEKDYLDAFIGFHSFTGNDFVSSFFRRGKEKSWKFVEKARKFQLAFKLLGENWTLPDDVYAMLEEFVCQLYGHRSKSTDGIRYKIYKEKYTRENKITDMATLPPCLN